MKASGVPARDQATVLLQKPAPAWLTLSGSQQELLKWTAVLTMTLDHANRTLWPFQSWAFAIGRLAFPLFVFLIAYNLTVRRVPVHRYLLPLLAFGLISQFPAMMVLAREYLPLNTLFALFLGVTFMPVCRYVKGFMPSALATFNIILIWSLLGLFVEYGPVGVFLIPATQYLLIRPSLFSAVLIVLLVPAANLFIPVSLVPIALPFLIWGVTKLNLRTLPRSSWTFYVYYPLHLLVLWGAGAMVA